MKYHELQASKSKNAKRVGRGIAAGQGKTAGRGTKGQGARTGSSKRPGFAGGQNPLMQSLPKLPGFKSKRPKAELVYTGQLDKLGVKVDNAVLAEIGLVSTAYCRVKLVVKGDVTKKHEITLQGASEAAIAAVQKAGGSFEKVALQGRPVTRKKED
ncbi:MAG TPA: 50S ribosomal protein L15 [Candidatus Saccharimonadales bacterium]|nr:50S ribosomal protein L15 [Candidatus Saccharimonadales bacterium]